jgi:hypothetical protein
MRISFVSTGAADGQYADEWNLLRLALRSPEFQVAPQYLILEERRVDENLVGISE